MVCFTAKSKTIVAYKTDSQTKTGQRAKPMISRTHKITCRAKSSAGIVVARSRRVRIGVFDVWRCRFTKIITCCSYRVTSNTGLKSYFAITFTSSLHVRRTCTLCSLISHSDKRLLEAAPPSCLIHA